MTAPYFVNDAIPLRFAVLDDGKPLYPTGATVTVFDPIGSVVFEGSAQVMKNEVSFKLPEDVATDSGEYTFVFKVRLFNLGPRTHTMKVKVNPLPTGNESMESAGEEQEQTEDSWDIAELNPAMRNTW